ncbi:tetratricopeptide repeat protein, partial [Aeromonas caviae]
KQAGKWDQETIVSFFLCQYCSGEYLRFPDAVEFKVFRAMTCYNLGRSKEGMETLLGILATTTTDPALLPYRRAMALYAEDLDRHW